MISTWFTGDDVPEVQCVCEIDFDPGTDDTMYAPNGDPGEIGNDDNLTIRTVFVSGKEIDPTDEQAEELWLRITAMDLRRMVVR